MCEICEHFGDHSGFRLHCIHLNVEYDGQMQGEHFFTIDGEKHKIYIEMYDRTPAEFEKLVFAIRERNARRKVND